MLQLRVVQAEFGDCLILQWGSSASPRYLLIDGGPQGNYQKNLKGELASITQAGGCLEKVVLSHVDNDHVLGLLEMMAEIVQDRQDGKPGVIQIDSMWHNAFAKTMGAQSEIPGKLQSTFAVDLPISSFMPAASDVSFGISEGNQLTEAANELGLPLNQGFPDALIIVDDAPNPIALQDGLTLWVVGPTQRNLDQLKADWQKWLAKVDSKAYAADAVEADKVDRSVPNLSSIMLLAESDQRRILLTGDGEGDYLIAGLKQAGLLDANGAIHVDVLKMPHHGSVRNVNRPFFDTITADIYVISANGKYSNPDLATLIWLVEAAQKSQRKIQIVMTNPTDSSSQLSKDYPAADYGYELIFLDPAKHAITV